VERVWPRIGAAIAKARACTSRLRRADGADKLPFRFSAAHHLRQ